MSEEYINQDIERIFKAVAEEYNIDLEHLEKYDITNPEVSRRVDREIAERCRPALEAWDRAEAASRAAAHHLWTV